MQPSTSAPAAARFYHFCLLHTPDGHGAPVLVLHAWWGLTPVITRVCDDLADLGYVSVAPDLYRGEVAATAEEAAALRARKRSTPMWRQIVSDTLRARSQFDIAPVGQIGFSMGGHWALWLSKQSRPEIPPITATSVFYATRGGDFTASTSAFQFHLAETDPFVTKAGVAHQERQLRAAERAVGVLLAVHDQQVSIGGEEPEHAGAIELIEHPGNDFVPEFAADTLVDFLLAEIAGGGVVSRFDRLGSALPFVIHEGSAKRQMPYMS